MKSSDRNTGLRYKLRIGRLMRRDYGRHKHMDWRFFFVWIVQTSAATVFFLISLGALVLCGWGILSHFGWIPGPEGVPALQSLELYIQGHEIFHYIAVAVGCIQTFCTNGYYVHCVILLLVLILVFIEALSIFLNRLMAACEIRRYGI